MSKIPEVQQQNSFPARTALILVLTGLMAGCGRAPVANEEKVEKEDPAITAAKTVARTAGDNEVTEVYCGILKTRKKKGIMGNIAKFGAEYQAKAFREYLEVQCKKALGPDEDTTNNTARCARTVSQKGMKRLCRKK